MNIMLAETSNLELQELATLAEYDTVADYISDHFFQCEHTEKWYTTFEEMVRTDDVTLVHEDAEDDYYRKLYWNQRDQNERTFGRVEYGV